MTTTPKETTVKKILKKDVTYDNTSLQSTYWKDGDGVVRRVDSLELTHLRSIRDMLIARGKRYLDRVKGTPIYTKEGEVIPREECPLFFSILDSVKIKEEEFKKEVEKLNKEQQEKLIKKPQELQEKRSNVSLNSTKESSMTASSTTSGLRTPSTQAPTLSEQQQRYRHHSTSVQQTSALASRHLIKTHSGNYPKAMARVVEEATLNLAV